MKNYFSFILTISAIIFYTNSFSQETEEPILNKFRQNFNSQYFNLGVVVQVVGDFQFERNIPGYNGFNLANFRLRMNGEFDKGFGYFVQTSFTGSPAILDAKIFYKLSDAVIFDAGLFKAPFSAEFLIGAPDIDFVNRSQVASSLAVNRQLGFQIGGLIPGTGLNYAVGIFNGNRFADNVNDNNDFLYAGRVVYNSFLSDNQDRSKIIEFGLNAAYSKDSYVNIPSINNSFSGIRRLFGGDARINYDRIMLSGEVIYGELEASAIEINPFGYQTTFAFMILENFQMLLRWEFFRIDSGIDPREQAIFGFNLWTSTISELQLNYIIPSNSMLKNNQVLINAQINF